MEEEEEEYWRDAFAAVGATDWKSGHGSECFTVFTSFGATDALHFVGRQIGRKRVAFDYRPVR